MTTVCLSFDFDAVSLWVGSFRQTSATPVSRGEYGTMVGLPRVLELLARKDVRATFFVPAHTAVSYPQETRRILAEGYEIGVHGDCHETPVGLAEGEEARLLDRALARLREALGERFRPMGYRSPAWDLSPESVALLNERGFLYDSSMMADDFTPYRARTGDRVDQEMLQPGRPTPLVEMPVAWELDDFPYFTFLNKPLHGPMRTPEEVLACWRAEFDWCHDHVPEGVFTLTMHPQIIGRGPRIDMLGRLIDHMQARGATFRTLAEEARRQDARLPPAS
ncbi:MULTISPECIES: polysaccharide deacetylase family protein [Paracoccaceae]|jgi:peptidoglycan/xylan/chitin deacetylase (PgdA/CDA1 family)|uniref:polysaccharide deacetylase family protein n=1 Tax=Paracoccaceae TaxID=31989 RepID=UPI00306C9203